MAPYLTSAELSCVEGGVWFASLSKPLQSEILSRATVKRTRDGQLVSARGGRSGVWWGVASGAMRVCSTSTEGKSTTLTYVEPGCWLGDLTLIDGYPNSHDMHAHGDSTLLAVQRSDFQKILASHPELYAALLLLSCNRLRTMFEVVADLNTLSLRSRCAKRILQLAKTYGIKHAEGIELGIKLDQSEWAQMLGASRQHVNLALKNFEREGVVRTNGGRLFVRSEDLLVTIANGDSESRLGDKRLPSPVTQRARHA